MNRIRAIITVLEMLFVTGFMAYGISLLYGIYALPLVAVLSWDSGTAWGTLIKKYWRNDV